MKHKKHLSKWIINSFATLAAAAVLTGCKSTDASCPMKTSSTPEATPVAASTATRVVTPAPAPVAAPAAVPAPKPAAAPAPIRIKAGATEPVKDSAGNTWLADTGFVDGDTIERADLTIENTKDPAIYLSERYSMTAFAQPLPNGNYIVKLHFAETFEGVSEAGQRVFSFNVEGTEFKDFDVVAKAGGVLRAYVENVPVEIKDGKLDITFTPNIENPQINGIEIIPAN